MMVHQLLYQALIIQTGLSLFAVNATYVDYVTSGTWNGVGFNIAVKREKIQEKLDAYHSSISDGCGDGPKLVLPEKQVFPELETREHHFVHVDFGYLTSRDFDDFLEDNPHPCVSVSGLEVAVIIPLLAANASGPPIYALALAKLYEKSRGDIPKSNFLYPYIPVDEIQFSDSEGVVKKGSDELRVSIIKHNDPCEPPRSIAEEFDEFFVAEFHFGLPKPDFSFCDRHSFQSDFCTNAKRVQCAVHRHAPNLCQKYNISNPRPCEALVEILNVTSGFRDLILLGNDPVNILSSESYSGDTVVGLKYPCQE
ncbi:hypothetical protein HOLleu_38662 [Holothuria leucospilota]|uniref:Uncharacterized protein n=1 Tax=Holothuria leucospilota TaxID=206669 RepID=A0A9Q1BDI7_HOLLE|nr:hypothetical protein HOLleu_38662 [Holothuria leucospilota]